MQLKWTHESRQDLDRFIDFLIDKNPEAALRAIDAIEKGAERLCDQPSKGVVVSDSEYRDWPIQFGKYGYTLRYFADMDTNILWVIRVWAGKENR